jgi:serine phosphatase RsbU (regulator of sigma subunit)
MPSPVSARRLVRHSLAILFAALATTYCVLWIVHMRHPRPQLGFSDYEYSASAQSMIVGVVFPESRSEQAGLRPGDRILAIDGQKLESLRPFYESMIVGQKDTIELSVQDANSSAGARQLELVLRGGKPVPIRMTRLEHVLQLPMGYFPLGFLIVGLTVLLLRPDDPNAWLLALFCGSFIAGGPLQEGAIPVNLRGFAVTYKMVMSWCAGAFFYYLFAVFPAPSPLDRKVPWLKYALLGGVLITTAPMGFRCLLAGGALPLYLDTHWPGWATLTWALTAQGGLPVPASHVWPAPALIFFGFFLGTMMLGLASLISNDFLSADVQIRRKAHVMLWGTAVSFTPIVLALTATVIGGLGVVPVAVWETSILLLSFVWPLSFAYGVVKHRVLEIPVLLRRSARYVLVQRGYFVFLFAVAAIAIALFTHTISRFFPEGTNIGMALSAVFGIVLVWASAPMVKRGTERIDRAFFRSAYDARQILENVVEQMPKVASRQELSTLLEGEIGQALHPTSMAVYLSHRDGQLHVYQDVASMRFQSLSPELPLLGELARDRKPREVSVADASSAVSGDLEIFAPIQPECLVPMLRRVRLTGVIVLGPRVSEEPYSSEDKRLLASVANQAGVALESIHLAEEMAERIEAERRAAQEMAFATEVQARLFPQKFPPLTTLEYSGRCIQARQVGGDYYDFLSLGSGRLGIVLADIAGKGISGALLMANLQANLRSQYAMALEGLPQLLKSVNQLFYENTSDSSYATLFFGDYQDSTRRLRYANCGHNPPILLRTGGSTERLVATATVVGLFEAWDCFISEVQIAPGDIFVIYTDGITEATGRGGEEFGEKRLLDAIHASRYAPVRSILDAVLSDVQKFSTGEQADDLTLVVARGL